MKTLFLCSVQIYLLCYCTCIFGIPQPRPERDNSNKLSSEENTLKKCQDVNVEIRKDNFLDEESLLCFGLKVFSQRFLGGLETSAVFAGAEKKSDNDICKHFQEMRLNTTQTKLNGTVEIYNLLFQNKTSCERACLDIIRNVNPLCRIILHLSHHSEANTIVNVDQASSTILSDDKMDNDDNEVSGQSRKFDVPSISIDEQKSKASDVDQGIVGQGSVSNNQEKTFKGQRLDLGDKSVSQNTEIISPPQQSQGLKLPLTHNEQTEQTDVRQTGYVEGQPNVVNEESTLFTERAKEQFIASRLPKDKVHNTTPSNNSVNDNSNKESKVSNVEDIQSVEDINNEGKSDALLLKKQMEPSSVVLPKNSVQSVVDGNSERKSDALLQKEKEPSSVVMPESSGDDKKEQVTPTGSKLQKKVSTVIESLTPKKVDTATGLKEEDGISQVPNVEEGKGIVNGQKYQTDNKETENSPHKEADTQTDSKMITEETPNRNTDEQETNRNSQKN